MKLAINKNIIISFLIFIFLVWLFYTSITFFLLKGEHVGEIEAKIKSIHSFSRIGRIDNSLEKAIAISENGNEITIICKSSCLKNEKIKINIYKQYFTNNIIYIHEDT